MSCKTKYINFEDQTSLTTILKQLLREDSIVFVSSTAFEKFKEEEALVRQKNQEVEESFYFKHKTFSGVENCFIGLKPYETTDNKKLYLLDEYFAEETKKDRNKIDKLYYKYDNRKKPFEIIVVGGNEIPKSYFDLLSNFNNIDVRHQV